MRLGFVIPTYIQDEQRRNWAVASFRSLAKTAVNGPPPVLCFVLNSSKDKESDRIIRSAGLSKFDVLIIEQPLDAASIDACNVFGWSHILKIRHDVTHLGMLTSDWLYNPQWLIELEKIMARHPQAKAWWVYRSAHEYYHKTLRIEQDVLVRSFNAGGCFPAADYRTWKPDYHNFRIDNPRVMGARYDERTHVLNYTMASGVEYSLPPGATEPKSLVPLTNGLTLDLYDPWLRPGERWVTKRSYIMNLGLEGVNQRTDAPEYAIDFVGTGETEAPTLNDESLEQPDTRPLTPEIFSVASTKGEAMTPTSGLNLDDLLKRLEAYELTICLTRRKP